MLVNGQFRRQATYEYSLPLPVEGGQREATSSGQSEAPLEDPGKRAT